jgi:hypothetical protein
MPSVSFPGKSLDPKCRVAALTVESSWLQPRTKQTSRSPLLPIQPSVRTESATDSADHARAEAWYRHIIRVTAHINHALMMAPASTAIDGESPHARGVYLHGEFFHCDRR